MRRAPQFTYPLLGLFLGAGAPVGSLLIRLLTSAAVRQDPAGDLRANAFFYLYELVATSLVFVLAGVFAGRQAERLRRGEAFYHYLAEHDSLTGLHNAGAFMDRYRRAVDRAATAGQPLALLLLDVDKLKEINDTLGHPAGNRALLAVADALRRSKRASDVAARWGGDEFAILLERADWTAALRVAEGIREQLSSPLVSVTIGICASAHPTHSADLFAAADRALLTGKSRGRNTIEIVAG